MNQEDMHKLIDARIAIALDARLGKLEEAFNAHKNDMEPVIEFFKTVNSLNKFLKWGGISLFALLTALYFFIKKL